MRDILLSQERERDRAAAAVMAGFPQEPDDEEEPGETKETGEPDILRRTADLFSGIVQNNQDALPPWVRTDGSTTTLPE